MLSFRYVLTVAIWLEIGIFIDDTCFFKPDMENMFVCLNIKANTLSRLFPENNYFFILFCIALSCTRLPCFQFPIKTRVENLLEYKRVQYTQVD